MYVIIIDWNNSDFIVFISCNLIYTKAIAERTIKKMPDVAEKLSIIEIEPNVILNIENIKRVTSKTTASICEELPEYLYVYLDEIRNEKGCVYRLKSVRYEPLAKSFDFSTRILNIKSNTIFDLSAEKTIDDMNLLITSPKSYFKTPTVSRRVSFENACVTDVPILHLPFQK